LAVIAEVTVPFTGRGHSFQSVPGVPENWSAWFYVRLPFRLFPGLHGSLQYWCCRWSWMGWFRWSLLAKAQI